jgi:hypothetical protein
MMRWQTGSIFISREIRKKTEGSGSIEAGDIVGAIPIGMRAPSDGRLEALLQLSQSRRPSDASKGVVKQYIELAVTSKQRDDVQERMIIAALRKADVEVSPAAKGVDEQSKVVGAVRAAMKPPASERWNSITASEHRLVAAQLRLTMAAMAGDRKRTSEMAMQNSKLALVFAALDPAKVEVAFSQIPMEELRGIIKGVRKVMGSSGWLKWFESRQGITTKFCRMLTELKLTMSEQLQDTARVRAAYRFLQREAPQLGNMLTAWSDEAFRVRPWRQSGGGWDWLRMVKKGVVTFLRVVQLALIATVELVLYVPVLVCKLVYPKDGELDDRYKTSIFAWPFYANQMAFLDVIQAVHPRFLRQYMGDPKQHADVMEIRFMHANRGRHFASLDEYQKARQDWIAANASRYI